jgi:hypothetical protein
MASEEGLDEASGDVSAIASGLLEHSVKNGLSGINSAIEEVAIEQAEAPSTKEAEDETRPVDLPEVYLSHFCNADAHPAWLRYFIPLYLLATFVLLLNSDIGSGVSADYILIRDGNVIEERSLFVASIFSSVKELWLNGSYPLAILIAVTSIAWPYLKIILSVYAWVMPYKNPRRRELLIETIDALGKWSFVDIVVLVEIMVAFRYVHLI